jgi:hypothetical protein
MSNIKIKKRHGWNWSVASIGDKEIFREMLDTGRIMVETVVRMLNASDGKRQGRMKIPAMQESAMTHWAGPNIPIPQRPLSLASHETSKFRPATRAKNTS